MRMRRIDFPEWTARIVGAPLKPDGSSERVRLFFVSASRNLEV